MATDIYADCPLTEVPEPVLRPMEDILRFAGFRATSHAYIVLTEMGTEYVHASSINHSNPVQFYAAFGMSQSKAELVKALVNGAKHSFEVSKKEREDYLLAKALRELANAIVNTSDEETGDGEELTPEDWLFGEPQQDTSVMEQDDVVNGKRVRVMPPEEAHANGFVYPTTGYPESNIS